MIRRLAVPFVATMSFAAGCTKTPDNPPPPITNDPHTVPTTSGPESPAPQGSIVYDGYDTCYRVDGGDKKFLKCPLEVFAAPPTDELVYAGSGGACNRVPDNRVVRCPEGGPTAILPDPDSIKRGDGTDYLQHGTLKCHHSVPDKCPPSVPCNPPGPTPIECPPELMPKLAGHVKPTKTQGGRCWFGSAEVSCPKK